MSRKPDFFYRKKGKVRPGFIRRGRRKIAVGEGLTRSQAERRVYPQTGSWDSDHDTDELIQAVKKDSRISDDRRRKRLQLLYSLTFREGFSKQYKGNITEARSKLKRAYQEYTKPNLGHGNPNGTTKRCRRCGYWMRDVRGGLCPTCRSDPTAA